MAKQSEDPINPSNSTPDDIIRENRASEGAADQAEKKKEKELEEIVKEIPQTGVASEVVTASTVASSVAAERVAENLVNQADKREPRKPAIRILEQQIQSGLNELERSTSGLFMAGLSAGMDLGFSIFLMGVLMTLDQGRMPRPLNEIVVATAYAIGFILVVIGRSELFTEHTALAVLPVLNNQANVKQLMRLWAIIFSSNILGGAIFAGLVVLIGPALGVIDPSVFGDIAHLLIDHPFWVILLSGLLAGWLMGLLSWLVAAARDTVSQILIILLITFTIGLGHLHHAIAGSIEVLTGLFAGQGVTWAQYGFFLLWTTIGNSIGGVFFVAVIKYGHVIQSNPSPSKVNVEPENNKKQGQGPKQPG